MSLTSCYLGVSGSLFWCSFCSEVLGTLGKNSGGTHGGAEWKTGSVYSREKWTSLKSESEQSPESSCDNLQVRRTLLVPKVPRIELERLLSGQRALPTLAEKQRLVPCTQTMWLTITCNSSSRGSATSGLHGHLQAPTAQLTYTVRNKLKQIFKVFKTHAYG